MGRWLGKILGRQTGSSFYASPSGSSGNSGTFSSPWDLESALLGGTGGTAIQPGDTLWLRGGNYTGKIYNVTLTGTAFKPIKVRQYPAERATVDGNIIPTLASNVDNVTTSIPLSSAAYPSGGNIHFFIDSEEMIIQSRSGTTYTVQRGYNSTPAPHTAGADAPQLGYANLTINGAYTWFIGFELVNTLGVRTSTTVNPPPGFTAGTDTYGVGTKLINMVVHDVSQGFGFWANCAPAEMYGCLVYNIGYIGSDRPHGHNVYTQCASNPGHTLTNNIWLAGMGAGNCNAIQAYGSSGSGFTYSTVQGNLWSMGNAIFGGGSGFDLTGCLVTANYSYVNSSTDIGHNSTSFVGFSVTNNYLDGDNSTTSAASIIQPSTQWPDLTFTGCTIIGNLDGFVAGDFPLNTYYAKGSPPVANSYVVLGNSYEPNRANVYCYNRTSGTTLAVDLSSVVANGTAIDIFNAQDFYGGAVWSGTYSGGTVAIPQTGLGVAPGLGYTPPGATGPIYNAFIVRAQGI